MSIATLKKKTQYNYNNNSVNRGHLGFSLNGTHRSQGWVGQDLRSRTLVRTLNRAGANRGHGGCCGKYPQPFVIPSEIRTTENINVVKPSVINTNGMYHEKFAWRWGTRANWKPDDYHGLADQGSYLEFLNQQTILCSQECCLCDYLCTKPILGAMNESDYLQLLKSCCAIVDSEKNFTVSRNHNLQFPYPIKTGN